MKRLLSLFLVALLAFGGPTHAMRASSGVNQGAVAITGGTITGITDLAVADGGTGASTAQTAAQNLSVPYVLAQSGIPFIHLSSGSVSALGAITGITALPLAYGSAYCYFPANILATAIAAGWYYCTFSTTTAGTAFLDAYTSGAPTVPSSPTPVTDGKGAFTGDVTERAGPSITVPAGAIGANGSIEVTFTLAGSNTANTKSIKAYFNGTGGTALTAAIPCVSTALTVQGFINVANAGTAATQGNTTWTNNGITVASTATTFNTAVSSTFDISIAKNTATEYMVMERFKIIVNYGA